MSEPKGLATVAVLNACWAEVYENDQFLTVKELAARTQLSEGAVRKAVEYLSNFDADTPTSLLYSLEKRRVSITRKTQGYRISRGALLDKLREGRP